jgi:uncharacterized protein DUF3485
MRADVAGFSLQGWLPSGFAGYWPCLHFGWGTHECWVEKNGTKKMSMTIRYLVAAAIVAGIYAGVRMLDGGGIPTTGTSPQQNLDDLPRQLGDWQGENQEMDRELFLATGATFAVNRRYTQSAGGTVNLHATVTVFSRGWNLPHPPPRCYTGTGHTILQTKIVKIGLPGGGEIPAQLMTVELAGKRSYVLYWYQVGDQIIHDGEQMRQLSWTMRGKDAWPPVLKLMLTTTAPEEYQAIKHLESLAEPLAEWAGQFR